MTLVEKLLIVAISVTLSTFTGVLVNFLYRYLDRRTLKKALSREFSLLVDTLYSTVANGGDATECHPTIDNLTKNYVYFCKDKEMDNDFKKIRAIYLFLRSGGYEKEPSRKEDDLQTVIDIQKQLH